jgi:hypothetical protein
MEAIWMEAIWEEAIWEGEAPAEPLSGSFRFGSSGRESIV